MIRLLFPLLVAFLVAPVWADSLAVVAPSEAGLSAERLARIRAVTEEHVEEGRLPGAVCLIARDGEVAYFEAIGFADLESKRAMYTDAIFRIYSMTKPITSVAAMMLFEEGRFLLTNPVEDYLPELSDREVAVFENGSLKRTKARRSITIQDLLRHTSGFSYGLDHSDKYDKLYRDVDVLLGDRTLAETLEKLADIPLKHHPGEQFTYGVNTDILARLVEVVSGRPFDVFLKERIFDPLGMVDTGFTVPLEKRDWLAQLYTRDDEDALFANPRITRSYMGVDGYFSGGAGLFSTAADYFRFCQMLLNGGTLDGVRLLSPKTVELMRSDALGAIPASFPWAEGSGFGLGFQVVTDLGAAGRLGSEGMYGWGGAAGTRFWIDPAEDLIAIYMVQILPHTGLTFSSQYTNLVYQAVVESRVE